MTDVREDGMTTSSYGAEDTWKIHGVLLVTKSFHLMPRMHRWHVIWNACSLRESSCNSVIV